MGGYCVKELGYSLILCLGSLTFGYVMAFPSPALPQMQDDWGKPSVPEVQWTFFNSITALSAIFGPFITKALLLPRFRLGRRITCFILAVCGCGFWLIMLAHGVNRFWVGLVARCLLGLTIGAFSALCPMYIVELAPPEATGFFGTLNQLCIATGVVVLYLVGSWVSWKYIAVIGAVILGALSLLVWLVPESPATGQVGNASDQGEDSGETVFSKTYICPLLVCIAFMFFQQLSGINAILTNLGDLFSRAGVTLETGYASAIAAIAQVIACLAAGFLIEKFGRRVVWIISFGMITVTDLLYGIYELPKLRDNDTFPTWFPILVIFLNLLGFVAGAGPIPWFIVAEMFPDSVRPSAVSIVSTSNWVFAFAVLQLFPEMQKGLELWGCFILFAVVSLIGTIFGLFYVKNPEIAEDKSPKDEAKLSRVDV
jgi:MFS family permease